jgi:aspartokinase-like uncharacterized kinase
MMRRIVKVGGSLFVRPRLGAELAAYLRALPEAENWLVVGGGPVADGVRTLDAWQALPAEVSHWAALRSLQVTADVLAYLLRVNAAPPVQLVDVWTFAQADENRSGHLPHSWATTTDSLAARFATVEQAEELILLKSCGRPEELSWVEAAIQGIVDPIFPQMVVGQAWAVRWCNFPLWAKNAEP